MTSPDLPALIARVRELDANPRAWQAPWVAHTFEIDCPCPNGNHCGDPHTCEEVESPEAYPDGQCVVQISVPGLETFARPTAELIAYYRTAAPLLADECSRLQAEVTQLRAERDMPCAHRLEEERLQERVRALEADYEDGGASTNRELARRLLAAEERVRVLEESDLRARVTELAATWGPPTHDRGACPSVAAGVGQCFRCAVGAALEGIEVE